MATSTLMVVFVHAPPLYAVRPFSGASRVLWGDRRVVAVAATAYRGYLDERQLARREADPRAVTLRLAIALRAHRVTTRPRLRTAISIGTGIGAAAVLAGLTTGLVQGVVVAAFLCLVLLARDALQRSTSPAVSWLMGVPVLVRLAAAFAVGWFVAQRVLERAWMTNLGAFRPLLLSVCFWVALMTLAAVRGTPPALEQFSHDVDRRSA